MSAIPEAQLTHSEYLAIERKATVQSEFFAGEMFATTRASREHNLIVGNREDNGKWGLTEVTGLDGALVLESVLCSINVAEIYSKVEFPPASDDNLR